VPELPEPVKDLVRIRTMVMPWLLCGWPHAMR
jgi:hypothetical protein